MMVPLPPGTTLSDGLLLLTDHAGYSTQGYIFSNPGTPPAFLLIPPTSAAAPTPVKKTPMTGAQRSKKYRDKKNLEKRQAERDAKRDDFVTRRDENVTNRDGSVTQNVTRDAQEGVCVLNLNNLNNIDKQQHTLTVTSDVTPVTKPSRNVTSRRDADSVTPPVKSVQRVSSGILRQTPGADQTYLPLDDGIPEILRTPKIENAWPRFIEKSIGLKPSVTADQHAKVMSDLEAAARQYGVEYAEDCLDETIRRGRWGSLWYAERKTAKAPPSARKSDPPPEPDPPPETPEERAASVANIAAFRRYLAAGKRLTPDSDPIEFREEDWPPAPTSAETRQSLQRVGLFTDKFSVPKNPPRKTPPPDG